VLYVCFTSGNPEMNMAPAGRIDSCAKVAADIERLGDEVFPFVVGQYPSFDAEPRPALSRRIMHSRPEHPSFTNRDVDPVFMKWLPSRCAANRVVNSIDVLAQRSREFSARCMPDTGDDTTLLPGSTQNRACRYSAITYRDPPCGSDYRLPRAA
jgi:hypothetical protein